MIIDGIVVAEGLVETEGKLLVEGSEYTAVIHFELRGSEFWESYSLRRLNIAI